MVKKLLSLLLAGTMLLPTVAVFAEDTEEKPEPIVLQLEKAETEGALTKVTGETYSGGGALQLNTTAEQENTILMDFDVDITSQYDIWICSTLGATDYVTKWSWMMEDDEKLRSYSGVDGGGAGYSVAGAPVYWRRIDQREIAAGEHTFKIVTESTKRSLNNDFMLAAFDCLYIIPTSWQWSPSGITEPFDVEKMHFSFVSAELDKETTERERDIKVTFTNKANEVTPYNGQFCTELRYKGETVTKVISNPSVALNKWKKDKEYTNTVTIQAPFNAPDGLYEIWTGFYNIPYDDGDDMKKVGDIVVGKMPEEAVDQKLTVSDVKFPETLERYKDFSVEVSFTGNQDETEVKPYIEFYSAKEEKELWYVAEGKTSINIEKGVTKTQTFEFNLEADIPDGDYKVRFGVHMFKNDGKTKKITVSGGDMRREKSHKPLTYGFYRSTKTGNCQFWYVDQTHTLIWNGEPYVPMGGMYCSPYILNRSSKAAYEAEVARLDDFKAKGIKHLYLNTNGTVPNPPNWFMEHYYQLLKERGIFYGLQTTSPDLGTEYFSMRSLTKQISADVTESGLVTVEDNVQWGGGNSNVIEAGNIWVVIDTETGATVDSGLGTAKVEDSATLIHSANITLPGDGNYKIYFLPWARKSSQVSMRDPFYRRDEWNEIMTDYYERLTSYDNFRDLVDPVRNEWGFHNTDEQIRFSGGDCDEQYASWLKERYGTIDKLNDTWAMLDKAESFDIAAGLLPVYTESAESETNISYCVNRTTGKAYRTNARKGCLWDDYIEFRNWITGELHNDFADIASSNMNSDVPVMTKHISVLEDYNVNTHTYSGVDGMGGEIYGSYDMATAKRSYPYSEIEAAGKTQWFVLTEGNTEEQSNVKAASDTPSCYNTEEQMHQYFDDHLAQGMKGIYDFLLYWEGDPSIEVWDYSNKPECYDWNTNYREYIEEHLDEIVKYERNDGKKHVWFYPGTQTWWTALSSRGGGTYNDDYVSMRVPQWEGEPVLTTFDPFVDKEMLIVNLENSPATVSRYGRQYNAYLASLPEDEIVVHTGLRHDLGQLPIIDKYYTDEFITDGEATIQVLAPTETSQVLLEKDGKPYALRDGNIYIIATTDWSKPHPTSDQWRLINDDVFASVGLHYNVGSNHGRIGVDLSSGGNVSGGSQKKENNVAFTDIEGHWAKSEIENLAKQGIIAGRSESEFAPDEQVTRAEFLQLAFASINMQLYDYAGSFGDVSKADWYAKVMQTANETRLLAREFLDGTNIMPNKAITRQEAASIVSKLCAAAGKAKIADISVYKDAESVDAWAKQDVQNAVAQKIMYGDDLGCLNPNGTLTRAEAAALTARFMNVYLAK